jgi:predicted ATP-dependent endonuclease of OLD family
MKLKKFRIKNYKSIENSGFCWLSPDDNILVLAGQNESGKSSILQALKDFDNNELREGALREGKNEVFPMIECVFEIEKVDYIREWLIEGCSIRDEYVNVFKGISEITIKKNFTANDEFEFSLDNDIEKKIIGVANDVNMKAASCFQQVEIYKEIVVAISGLEKKIEEISQPIDESNLDSQPAEDEIKELKLEIVKLSKTKDQSLRFNSVKTYVEIESKETKLKELIKNINKKGSGFQEELKALKDQLEIASSDDEIEEIQKSITEKKNDISSHRRESNNQKRVLRNEIKTTKRICVPLVEVSDDGINKMIKDIAYELYNYTPKFILFDDFCDLLPAKINISELKEENKDAKGYQAVKNIETILKTNFVEFDGLKDGLRDVEQEKFKKSITAKFNEKWKQRISSGKGARIHIRHNQGKAKDASYLTFFVETKDGEWLNPDRRSQGLKWFLSFYLQLKAQGEREKSLVILFDEPGLFLHAKAQQDMMDVFAELSEKHKIIYSTHSPYLINTNYLNRIRLVLNTEAAGTTIEKITTIKIKDQKEALKPVIDAIGLDLADAFSPVSKKNVILEGISDFYYFCGMKKILEVPDGFSFIPSMGAPNVHLLMELCIGWGLDWLIVLDKEKQAKTAYNKIKKEFFLGNEEDVNKKIKLIEAPAIEDLFIASDFILVKPDASFEEGVSLAKKIDEEYEGKVLFAKQFFEKVNSAEINRDNISQNAKDNFQQIFDYIAERFEE